MCLRKKWWKLKQSELLEWDSLLNSEAYFWEKKPIDVSAQEKDHLQMLQWLLHLHIYEQKQLRHLIWFKTGGITILLVTLTDHMTNTVTMNAIHTILANISTRLTILRTTGLTISRTTELRRMRKILVMWNLKSFSSEICWSRMSISLAVFLIKML